MESSEYQRVIQYLKHDVTNNLPTLKYLSIFPDRSITSLLEDDTGWAVSVELPVSCITYDTKAYPLAEKVVFLNGTSRLLKYKLLSALTPSRYVLKLNEDLDLSLMNQQYQVAKGHSFLSFSSSVIHDSGALSYIDGKRDISDEIIRFILKNGYEENEISGNKGSGLSY